MTTPTPLQTIFALLVLGAALIASILTRRPSIKASMQRQRDEWAELGVNPENAMIDTRASFGANVLCILWSALGAYLAVAILLGDPTFWMH